MQETAYMGALVVTGKLLLGLASAGFGATLGFVVKQLLERRGRAGGGSDLWERGGKAPRGGCVLVARGGGGPTLSPPPKPLGFLRPRWGDARPPLLCANQD